MNHQAKIGLTAVIAVQDGGRRLRSCLLAINAWVGEILVVLPRADATAAVICRELGGSVIIHNSGATRDLWEEGVRHASYPWVLLLRSNEVVTGRLKKTIRERVGVPVTGPVAFPLPQTTVFLKKRFKYPLAWSDFEPSRLLFAGGQLAELKSLPRKAYPFQPELIHYGDETISEVVATILEIAERRAERLSACISAKTSLGWKAFYSSFRNGLRVYFLRGGFKEGFEGIVFAVAEVMATLLGYFRYYEEYVRGGGRVAKKLDALQDILLIKLREIGDNVLSTPVIRNLKQNLPQARITVLTYDSSRAVFENNPHIERLIGLPKNTEASELDARMAKLDLRHFDLAVNLHAGKLSAAVMEKISAEFKINQYYIGRDNTGGILAGESDYYRSAIERELDCLRRIGIQPTGVETELFLTAEERDWAKTFLADQGFDTAKPFAVIHPTASRQTKEWGMERFGRLAKELMEKNDVQVLLTCSPDEEPRLKALLDHASSPVFTGPLRQLMAIIQEADLMIDNDSGPSHIAVALNVPTVTLLGPNIKEIFNDYYSGDDRHFLFYKEVPCRECGLLRCDNKICLDFTVEEVLDKCLQSLAKHKIAKALKTG
ncbi:MAG: glycosyltransferase family 9 protein [Nitrospinales bacterium]